MSEPESQQQTKGIVPDVEQLIDDAVTKICAQLYTLGLPEHATFEVACRVLTALALGHTNGEREATAQMIEKGLNTMVALIRDPENDIEVERIQ